jgi:GHMP kinases N terminal domain
MPSRPTSADRSLRLALPATSANLGPAFDAAALALDFHLRLRAERAPDFFVTAEGRDTHICGRMENHLIVTTYCEVLESENRKIAPLRIHIENGIPIGRGCGSSAAARLAGIALAVHFGHLRWKDDRIVGEASMREHHPDNASACWMGALTVARMANQVQAQVVEVKPKGKWPLLLAVPDAPLSTEQARRVLPFQYSRPSRPAAGCARRPHSPALSRTALSAAARAQGTDGRVWHLRRRPQRSRALGPGVPRPESSRQESETENRRPPREAAPSRRTPAHSDRRPRRTRWIRLAQAPPRNKEIGPASHRPLYLSQVKFVFRSYRLAGGIIPFMRRYSTICP